MDHLVAIVGRPNVGKSTLFNRILKKNRAITHDRSGVTRDRIYASVTWAERPFDLVDTGGILFEYSGEIDESVYEQVREAVQAAHLVLLIVDGREGLTPLDEQVAAFLRQSNKPVHLVVNKVDGPEREAEMTLDFHSLGLEMSAVSAAHGFGVGDLIQTIEDTLPEEYGEPESDETPEGLRLALIGRPNVGKSSLVNTVVGSERVIVSPHAGTTRDSIDVGVTIHGKRYVFLDTAGVRKRTRISDTLERFSVMRSLRSSKRAQVVILVLDAVEGIVHQDKKLLSFLDREKIPFIAAVNKFDLVPRERKQEFKRMVQHEFRIMKHVPVIFTSAVTRAGLGGLLPLAEKLWAECQIRVTTGQLNRFMQKVVERNEPPMVRRRRAKFYYMTQSSTVPPTFIFFMNDPSLLKPSYERFLENQIRKAFGFRMAPLQLYYRSSHKK